MLNKKKTANTTTKQLEYWRGDFGNQYTKRNSDNDFFAKRKPFFVNLITKHPDVGSILEVGCNLGGNLSLIQQINPTLTLAGIEPNEIAARQAQQAVPHTDIRIQSSLDMKDVGAFDLVFTAGVLIHIANTELTPTMHNMYRAAKKYILTIEYYDTQITTVPYRGLADALFKRPYDVLWHELYPTLQLIETGFLSTNDGFDNCNWWLFKK